MFRKLDLTLVVAHLNPAYLPRTLWRCMVHAVYVSIRLPMALFKRFGMVLRLAALILSNAEDRNFPYAYSEFKRSAIRYLTYKPNTALRNASVISSFSLVTFFLALFSSRLSVDPLFNQRNASFPHCYHR